MNILQLKQSALALLERNRNVEAGKLFEQMVAAQPSDAEAWYYLGIVHGRLGDMARAESCLRRAIERRPKFDQACYWLGMMLVYQNRPADAAEAFRQAVRINPSNLAAWNRLGKALEEIGNLDEAAGCFRKAIACQAGHDEAHANLGQTLYHQGRYEEALASYRRALDIEPANVKAALGFHLSLPIVYRDRRHLLEARQRYTDGLEALVAGAERFRKRASLINELLWSNGFYLAYQGMDDKPLQERFAAFFRDMAGAVLPRFMEDIPRRRIEGRRIRVGYVSHYFRQHTVSYYFRSWIEQADRDRFEISVYHLDPVADAVSDAIAAAAEHYCPLTGSLSAVAERIKNDQLDMLVYPEVGMHPRHLWLAALRLAPVQCVAWGHPVTTGLGSIDYYLSADATEPPDGREHYSEKLVRLSGMGVNCAAMAAPAPAQRADFGLPEDRTLYLCSQSLFKIHVDTDTLLAAVAAHDPRALLVLFEHGKSGVDDPFRQRIRAGFATRGLDPDYHVRILPRLNHADYLRFNTVVDVMLDTPHWSGGRTSFDALACGLPVVTLPGAFSRGRQTYGMLREIGMDELIASDPEDYVRKAVAIATDRERRDRLAQEIRQRAARRLFDNPAPIRSLEEFFSDAAR